jgi:hypothetical protein
MKREQTPIQFIKTLGLLTLVLFVATGCPKTSETTTADQDNDDVQNPGYGDLILAEHGIRLGMTIPDDGRTLLGIVDLSAMPAEGMLFGNVRDEEPHCICVCALDTGASSCTPAGCPNTCPVPLCPGGYVPPCPNGAAVLRDVGALVSQPPPGGRP